MMGAPFGGGGSLICELNDTWDVDQKFLMPVVVHVLYSVDENGGELNGPTTREEQINSEMQIVILSSRGEVLLEAVKPKHWEELVLNTASLSSGTYIIRCFSNSFTQSSSFVVVH